MRSTSWGCRATTRAALSGLIWPWLVSSEALHYAYAFVMLVGFFYLRKHFDGRAGTWWSAALVLQVWHHLEHQLLLEQAIVWPLFDADEPTSFLQLAVPRVELHLLYTAFVFVPMSVAMYLRHRQIRGAISGASSGQARRTARLEATSPRKPAEAPSPHARADNAEVERSLSSPETPDCGI